MHMQRPGVCQRTHLGLLQAGVGFAGPWLTQPCCWGRALPWLGLSKADVALLDSF